MYDLLLVVQGRCNYQFGALVKNHADFPAPGNPNFGAGLVRDSRQTLPAMPPRPGPFLSSQPVPGSLPRQREVTEADTSRRTGRIAKTIRLELLPNAYGPTTVAAVRRGVANAYQRRSGSVGTVGKLFSPT